MTGQILAQMGLWVEGRCGHQKPCDVLEDYHTFPTVSQRYSPCVGKGGCMFVIVYVALCVE